MTSNWKQRLKHNPLAGKKKKNGVALILAITSLMLMVYIAKEISRDSLTEYIVNSQELNRLKSYYAARNGLEVALLRVKLFQQAAKLPLPPAFASQLEQIWKFPFAWPLPITEDVNSVDKESMQKLMSESLMDASYTHTISDEGSKIDVNDLVSPSKTLRDVTKLQLMTLFERKIEFDEEFRNKHQNFQFEDLVNRMIDWMSEKNSSASGGDKKAYFSELGETYPPNRGFRTLDEMRLVPGMTEEFFNVLKDQVTIYGMKAINPNTASENVLKSLDKGMTDEAVKEAIARRNDAQLGGPFAGEKSEDCRKNFKDFVESRGARLSPEFDQVPMICDKTFNFRIKANGIYGSGQHAVMKEIEVVVMDINRAVTQIKSYMEEEKKQQNPQTPANPANPAKPTGPTSPAPKQEPLPKGPPRIVYWSEN